MSKSAKGSASVLHLITREAADEEKRLLENDIGRAREELAEKDRVIAEGKKKLDETVQIVKELEFEVESSP